MSIKLAIVNKNGDVQKEALQSEHVWLGYKEEYLPGDQIVVDLPKEDNYLVVDVDATKKEALIYVPGKKWVFDIISDTYQTAYHPNIFKGNRHYVSVRYATKEEIGMYRNLALNTHDQKEFQGAYPHASANVETRDDSTFFALNAIDGVYANDDHGPYPFQSWGINQDPNACLKLDFGRKVRIDCLGIVLRSDYPHDSYWTQATVSFSDGTSMTLDFEKIVTEQKTTFPEKEIEWLEFSSLKKADDESPFPALTQLCVYGNNC